MDEALAVRQQAVSFHCLLCSAGAPPSQAADARDADGRLVALNPRKRIKFALIEKEVRLALCRAGRCVDVLAHQSAECLIRGCLLSRQLQALTCFHPAGSQPQCAAVPLCAAVPEAYLRAPRRPARVPVCQVRFCLCKRCLCHARVCLQPAWPTAPCSHCAMLAACMFCCVYSTASEALMQSCRSGTAE